MPEMPHMHLDQLHLSYVQRTNKVPHHKHVIFLMLSEKKKKNLINFFTARCDYHVISHYNIHTLSSKQETRMLKCIRSCSSC